MDPTPAFATALALGTSSGVHLATVVSLSDPQGLSRVQVNLHHASQFGDQDAPVWARVCAAFAGNDRGAFWMPDVDDEVLVAFVQGDPRYPIVLGGLWNGSSAPPETLDANNYLKVVRSRNGVKLTMDDTPGAERLKLETPGGQSIELKDAGSTIDVRDASGNTASFTPSGVTLNAAAKVTVTAPSLEINASIANVNCPLTAFSGVVQCQTLITQTVVSSVYTPGAGNIW
jgi:uncharacterized protein involved in type VI secretion and phage assembly